ncbi:MAG TPA: hypothetical protein VKP60_13080 [Magnetospirillaceae bacterium]|nr:hypothetical protein [Magnetospirillaceae bacterium]
MRHTLICLVAASGLLSACTTHGTAEALRLPYAPLTALVLADGVSIMATSKTVEDHVVGWVSDQDCSVIRASHGGDYCVSKAQPPKMLLTSYCYRTLAKTTCYDHKIESDEGSYTGARQDLIPVNAVR